MLGPLSGPACCPVGLVDVCMLIWCRSNGGSWGQTSLYGCHCTMADGRAARWREVRRCGRSCLPQHRVNFNIGHMSVAFIENVYWAHIEAYIETCWQDVWKSFARIISNIGTEYIAHTLPPTQKPAVSNMYKKICQIILNFQYLKDHTRKLFFPNILDGGQCVQYWDRPVLAGVEAWRCPPPPPQFGR